MNRTPAEWALRWIWNRPEVSVVLSGMSDMQQLRENIESADRSGAGALSQADLAIVEAVRDACRRLAPIPCTNCQYCMPCPTGVEIADTFKYYKDATIYDNSRSPRFLYDNLNPDQRADSCVECFECEEKCPQGIPVAERLKPAHALLDETHEA